MKKMGICAMLLVLLILAAVILTGCAGKKESGQIYFSMDELQGADKTFSLWIGCGYEPYVEKYFPEAKMIFGEYVPDLDLNIKRGKADAMLLSEPYFNYFSEELSDTVVLPGELDTIDSALIFSSAPMGETLRVRFNSWLASAFADGTMDALREKWFGTDKSVQTLDYSNLDPEAEHIRVCLTADEPPFTFLKDDSLVGYDTELIVRFCRDCGYYPEVNTGEYSSMILGVQEDKYDVIGAGYEVIEERKESVSYSDPVSHNRVIVAVKGKEEKVPFFESVSRSFQRTFVEDHRARQFLNGIGVTILIMGCSVVAGTLFGFMLYFLDRDGGKIIHRILNLFSVVLNRVPAVVLLMVCYYIIFGKAKVAPTFVAILLFSVRFSFSTFGALTLAVNSIGKGQSEAAFTLGLTQNECFFRVLLPQGRTIFLANYKDYIVSDLLDSAVVGYVSVVDLTRVGDIIRNNTYEAFFPLIAVAVFYFIISSCIIALIERMEKRIEPMQRSQKQVLRSVMGKK